MKTHVLSECVLVWYTPYLKMRDLLDNDSEICDQVWADKHLDGINEAESKWVKRGR